MVAAAVAILDEGGAPTVTAAADRAGVSRATAYRYFASNERLQSEAILDRIAERLVALHLPLDAPDPETAVDRLTRQVIGFVLDSEAEMRLMLRLSLEQGGGGRGGRRLDWVRAVLAPHAAQLRPGAVERLARQMAPLLGIETVIALGDIAGLAGPAIADQAAAAARTLVAAERAG